MGLVAGRRRVGGERARVFEVLLVHVEGVPQLGVRGDEPGEG